MPRLAPLRAFSTAHCWTAASSFPGLRLPLMSNAPFSPAGVRTSVLLDRTPTTRNASARALSSLHRSTRPHLRATTLRRLHSQSLLLSPLDAPWRRRQHQEKRLTLRSFSAAPTSADAVKQAPTMPNSTIALLRSWRREKEEIPMYVNRTVEAKLKRVGVGIGIISGTLLLLGGLTLQAKDKVSANDNGTEEYVTTPAPYRGALFFGYTTIATIVIAAYRFYASRAVTRIALRPGTEYAVINTVNIPFVAKEQRQVLRLRNLWTTQRAYDEAAVARKRDGIYLMSTKQPPFIAKFKDGLFAPEFDQVFFRGQVPKAGYR